MRSVVAARLPALVGPRVGSGPPLLLLPGLGSTLAAFRAVLPSLALRYDVLGIELPGQGRSPALPATVRPTVTALTDVVEQELDRRGVTVPHVLGVSLGGRLGLELARRQRVRSVVRSARPARSLLPSGPTRSPCLRPHGSPSEPWPQQPTRSRALSSSGQPPLSPCARERGGRRRTRRRHSSAGSRRRRTSGVCSAARSCPRPRSTIERCGALSASSKAPTTSSRSARQPGSRCSCPVRASACFPSPATALSPTTRSG